jgi:hypothetical protein
MRHVIHPRDGAIILTVGRRARDGWGVIVVGTLLLASLACSDGYGPDVSFTQVRVNGIPVLEGHTRAEGAALDDGLVVPAGTVLLGEPLKIAHPLSNVRRWTAAFVVTGPFPTMIEDLRVQLEELGYRISSSCDRSPGAEPVSDVVSCDLRAVKDGPVGKRRLLTAEASRGQAPDRRPSSSYLYLELTAERPESEAVRDWGSTIEAHEGTVDDLVLPTGWPDLPTVGEAIFPAPGDDGSPVLRELKVPRNTSPLGPPVGSRVVLVQPEGRVARTFDDLVAEARAAIGSGAMVIRAPDADEDGVRVRFATIGVRGGRAELLIRAIEQDGHPSYLVLEAQY